MTRTVRPAATARFSVQPVAAATIPNAPTMAVPSTGRLATLRPAMTSATSRPCRFAGPASGTSASLPVTASRFTTASPTAKMDGSEVRWCSSTRMPPRAPSSRPAASASPVSGRTPIAATTSEAGSVSPVDKTTESAPTSVTDAPVSTRTPCRARCFSTSAASSTSKGARSWSASSTIVTLSPRSVRFSASSTPMKPPPMITAVGSGPDAAASTAAAILSVSPMLRRVRAREAPGIGGTNGAAPGASTRAS